VYNDIVPRVARGVRDDNFDWGDSVNSSLEEYVVSEHDGSGENIVGGTMEITTETGERNSLQSEHESE